MVFSTKYSFIFLKLGLAFVFFWFGIDKFLHPAYWINAWVPLWIISLVGKLGISATQFIYVNGVLEVLIGLSLVTGVFIKTFSLIATLFLLAVVSSLGFSEVAVRDIGLIGALMAVFFWPDKKSGHE